MDVSCFIPSGTAVYKAPAEKDYLDSNQGGGQDSGGRKAGDETNDSARPSCSAILIRTWAPIAMRQRTSSVSNSLESLG